MMPFKARYHDNKKAPEVEISPAADEPTEKVEATSERTDTTLSTIPEVSFLEDSQLQTENTFVVTKWRDLLGTEDSSANIRHRKAVALAKVNARHVLNSWQSHHASSKSSTSSSPSSSSSSSLFLPSSKINQGSTTSKTGRHFIQGTSEAVPSQHGEKIFFHWERTVLPTSQPHLNRPTAVSKLIHLKRKRLQYKNKVLATGGSKSAPNADVSQRGSGSKRFQPNSRDASNAASKPANEFRTFTSHHHVRPNYSRSISGKTHAAVGLTPTASKTPKEAFIAHDASIITGRPNQHKGDKSSVDTNQHPSWTYSSKPANFDAPQSTPASHADSDKENILGGFPPTRKASEISAIKESPPKRKNKTDNETNKISPPSNHVKSTKNVSFEDTDLSDTQQINSNDPDDKTYLAIHHERRSKWSKEMQKKKTSSKHEASSFSLQGNKKVGKCTPKGTETQSTFDLSQAAPADSDKIERKCSTETNGQVKLDVAEDNEVIGGKNQKMKTSRNRDQNLPYGKTNSAANDSLPPFLSSPSLSPVNETHGPGKPPPTDTITASFPEARQSRCGTNDNGCDAAPSAQTTSYQHNLVAVSTASNFNDCPDLKSANDDDSSTSLANNNTSLLLMNNGNNLQECSPRIDGLCKVESKNKNTYGMTMNTSHASRKRRSIAKGDEKHAERNQTGEDKSRELDKSRQSITDNDNTRIHYSKLGVASSQLNADSIPEKSIPNRVKWSDNLDDLVTLTIKGDNCQHSVIIESNHTDTAQRKNSTSSTANQGGTTKSGGAQAGISLVAKGGDGFTEKRKRDSNLQSHHPVVTQPAQTCEEISRDCHGRVVDPADQEEGEEKGRGFGAETQSLSVGIVGLEVKRDNYGTNDERDGKLLDNSWKGRDAQSDALSFSVTSTGNNYQSGWNSGGFSNLSLGEKEEEESKEEDKDATGYRSMVTRSPERIHSNAISPEATEDGKRVLHRDLEPDTDEAFDLHLSVNSEGWRNAPGKLVTEYKNDTRTTRLAVDGLSTSHDDSDKSVLTDGLKVVHTGNSTVSRIAENNVKSLSVVGGNKIPQTHALKKGKKVVEDSYQAGGFSNQHQRDLNSHVGGLTYVKSVPKSSLEQKPIQSDPPLEGLLYHKRTTKIDDTNSWQSPNNRTKKSSKTKEVIYTKPVLVRPKTAGMSKYLAGYPPEDDGQAARLKDPNSRMYGDHLDDDIKFINDEIDYFEVFGYDEETKKILEATRIYPLTNVHKQQKSKDSWRPTGASQHQHRQTKARLENKAGSVKKSNANVTANALAIESKSISLQMNENVLPTSKVSRVEKDAHRRNSESVGDEVFVNRSNEENETKSKEVVKELVVRSGSDDLIYRMPHNSRHARGGKLAKGSRHASEKSLAAKKEVDNNFSPPLAVTNSSSLQFPASPHYVMTGNPKHANSPDTAGSSDHKLKPHTKTRKANFDTLVEESIDQSRLKNVGIEGMRNDPRVRMTQEGSHGDNRVKAGPDNDIVFHSSTQPKSYTNFRRRIRSEADADKPPATIKTTSKSVKPSKLPGKDFDENPTTDALHKETVVNSTKNEPKAHGRRLSVNSQPDTFDTDKKTDRFQTDDASTRLSQSFQGRGNPPTGHVILPSLDHKQTTNSDVTTTTVGATFKPGNRVGRHPPVAGREPEPDRATYGQAGNRSPPPVRPRKLKPIMHHGAGQKREGLTSGL